MRRKLPYRDRREAGRVLGAQVRERLAGDETGAHVVVLALPRGGVPVAWEVARALGAPLDVLLVRKLGVPGGRELAMGAIASGGVRVLNHDVVEAYDITDEEIEEVSAEETRELERRERIYRGDRPRPELRGRTVVVVDDGLATGATMRAAIEALRIAGPGRIVAAAPVGAAETCAELAEIADDVICAATPAPFDGVGKWYLDFGQTTDGEVRELLGAATSGEVLGRFPVERRSSEVVIPLRAHGERGELHATLNVPRNPRGVVAFAHGSGSSRFSPRNRFVASLFEEAGLATFLADLLTEREEQADRHSGIHRFDIALLSHRLGVAIDWLSNNRETAALPIGCFGASTGAAAAVVAAAQNPERVRGVVSRGGRVDLAGTSLHHLRVPILLIVGGRDETVLELNRRALDEIPVADKDLRVVPGATHLFEEPGALDQVASLATSWFLRVLTGARPIEARIREDDQHPPR